MRMNAKQEYKMSLTTLNRHQLIRRNQQKWGRMVEKAQTVALLQKMKKVLELRKTVSDGFLNLLNDHPGRRLSLLDGLRVEDISDFDVELTAIAEDPTRLASSVHSESTAYALSPEETFSSPTKRHEYLFAEKDFSSEPILLSIRRSQSVPFEILESFADDPFYQLQELLPPINRTALRELELDEILTNSQLRHDLCFDPNLKFKPSADEASITLSETYWAEVKSEADSGALYRIPLLLAEIRQILIELLPNGDEQKADIFSNIDPKLVAQQIQHGIMNPTALVNYLSKLIKTNCAPIRDDLVDEMVLICGKGDISNTLKIAFELMEWMKLVTYFLTVGLCKPSDISSVAVHHIARARF